jgi:hypothetical protein
MSMEIKYLPPPGDPVAEQGLLSEKGRTFAAALGTIEKRGFVKMLSLHRCAETSSDVIVFSIEPERPQYLKNGIHRVEVIAVLFRDDDATYPEVLALRSDFPSVPHINGRHEEFPRSLCLYDQSWRDERPKWTPINFLRRIHIWLSKTADGSLHAPDQPLEPILFGSNTLLIVPPEIINDPMADVSRPLILTRSVDHKSHLTVVAEWLRPGLKRPHNWICLAVKCNPSTHGVIRRVPRNLADLHLICSDTGIDLLEEIRSKFKDWLLDPPFDAYQESKLLVIVILPKTRTANGSVESVETRAFMTVKHSVLEIGAALNVMDGKSSVADGKAGFIIDLNPKRPDPSAFSAFELEPVEMSTFLDSENAASMSGHERMTQRMLAIGAGAFGSQVLSNMVRSGSDNWTVVDHDLMRPHNLTRHLLGAEFIGNNKALAVGRVLSNAVNPWGPQIKAIAADFLDSPQSVELRNATDEAELIFDFSASIAVARHLSSIDSSARRISGFVTPSGSALVILVEDTDRSCSLDWLENLHYRLTLITPDLHDSLQTPGRIRTGASCRDISFIIGQAELAIWAGVFSQRIGSILKSSQARVQVFQSSSEGAIAPIFLEPTVPNSVRLGDWTVFFDQWLIERIAEYRSQRLPNETGGILLGVLDTERRTCMLTDALPSPPDSIEWPTSYIRGCNGLLLKMKGAESLTAGQVTYVGEWHSHPNGAGVKPSDMDLKAFESLKAQRDEECLPTVMLIVGDEDKHRFID